MDKYNDGYKFNLGIFYCRLKQGFPEYGCELQCDKTVTNEDKNEVSFCGALLDFTTGMTRPDFSPYFDRSVVHANKFKLGSNSESSAEDFIAFKMKFLCVIKFDPLFFFGS